MACVQLLPSVSHGKPAPHPLCTITMIKPALIFSAVLRHEQGSRLEVERRQQRSNRLWIKPGTQHLDGCTSISLRLGNS